MTGLFCRLTLFFVLATGVAPVISRAVGSGRSRAAYPGRMCCDGGSSRWRLSSWLAGWLLQMGNGRAARLACGHDLGWPALCLIVCMAWHSIASHRITPTNSLRTDIFSCLALELVT